MVELISDFAISSLPGLSGLGIQSREELGLHAGVHWSLGLNNQTFTAAVGALPFGAT